MSDTPLPDPAAQSHGSDMSIFGPRHLTRLMIAIMTVICCVIFTYGARWVHWPSEPGFHGSMAQAPMAIGGFLVALVLLILCTILSTFVLRRRYFPAGLMVATAGLTTWAVRGGTSTYVLFNADNSGAGPRVFLQLLGELIVLFAVIGGLWNVVWMSHATTRRASQPPDIIGDEAAVRAAAARAAKEESRSTGPALIVQAAVMTVVIWILVATPQKKQVLVAVFIAGAVSTALAESVFADRSASRWYWIGPLASGAFGYIASYFSPAGMEFGNLSGIFGAMAHVLPLDYASVGCAGALLGYWWMMPEEDAGMDAKAEPGAEVT